MEMKWLAIMMIGIFASAFTGITVERYADNQARIACYAMQTEAIKQRVETKLECPKFK